MTYRITYSLTCDACGDEIYEPSTHAFTNSGPPALPWLSRRQWRSHGQVYDLCDACAEPVSKAVGKVFKEARKK